MISCASLLPAHASEAALGAGAYAAAEPAAADRASGETKIDSVRTASVADSARPPLEVVGEERSPTPAPRKPSRFEKPRWVMLRSLVVPGWGQLHNGSWIKAIAIAGAEGAIGLKLLQDNRDLDRLDRQINDAVDVDDATESALIDEYNARLDHFVGRQWLLGAVVAYSLLDAYIDAHFRHFKIEFETDPALPAGVTPMRSLRLSLRWGE